MTRDITCSCGAEFEFQNDAVEHAKNTDHTVSGLYFSHRTYLEEYRHARGVCTHVEQWLENGRYRTVCIARNPVVRGEP